MFRILCICFIYVEIDEVYIIAYKFILNFIYKKILLLYSVLYINKA
ncbi:hypothetical protein KL86DYS2_11273 [uncultured Dysgonomonas sp.]|uniref:Uncharacterized protein n=1 Tax=uncultured Dysgonomonas sp. TaxID=206096 RepID=A0A212JDC1_9BACT|nr:hypothetical protein KL86DYS2_11273 [uncultured Dysgonomonas sp.]